MDQRNVYLLEAPLGKLMRGYAIPCIISLLTAALYNIVDQIFIGWGVGAAGNSATNIVFPLTVLALAIATMIGDAACSFVSIRMGCGDHENASRAVGSAVVLSVAAGILLMAVYCLWDTQILWLFGANDNLDSATRQYADAYFRWISVGIPVYMFGQAMNPIIRSDGAPRLAMAATVAGAAANVVLDPIAIFVFHWGVEGAAIATVAGQVITALISLIYLFRMRTIRLTRDSFLVRWRLVVKFIPLGFTSFLSQFSLVLSMMTMNNMVARYGAVSAFTPDGTATIPVAVLGIVMKFYQIVISVVVGMAAGCIPVVGFNYGAMCYSRCRKMMRLLLRAEAAVGAVALVLFQLFPVQLISIFGTDNSPLYFDFAKLTFRLYLCMMVLDCVNKAAFIFLQSLGKPLESTLLSLLREVVLAIPLAILLPWMAAGLWGENTGIYGLLVSMPCAALLTFLAAVYIILRTDQQLRGQECAGGQ